MKKHLPLLLFSIILAGCSPGVEEKPNFIIIMADDLGYSGIGCYGNKVIETPNLDKMAEEGIRFTDFHSNGTVCSPTRAALLTGKYQQRTGIEGVVTAARHRDVGLDIEEVTFADALKEKGYVTGIFGKWHVGYASEFNPVLQGFDEFKGYVSGNVDYHAHIDQEGYFDWWEGEELKDDRGYTTDLITGYGVEFIKENRDKPFLLYLPHEAPHSPFQRRTGDPVRETGSNKSVIVPADSIPGIYKEMVEVMDEGIGEIIQTLKDLGIDRNTMVFFCSDNGGARNYGHNEPLRGHKGQVYEGGHRVPAIAWWPGKIQPGVESGEILMTMDIFPTMLELSGSGTGQELDGISLTEVFLKNGELPGRDIFWRSYKNKAVRSEQWKLVVSGESTELYNLDEDLAETNNLAVSNPEKVDMLLEKLKTWEKDVSEGVMLLTGER
ncbi:MAG: sulfatase [Bacteroidota bacterium]